MSERQEAMTIRLQPELCWKLGIVSDAIGMSMQQFIHAAVARDIERLMSADPQLAAIVSAIVEYRRGVAVVPLPARSREDGAR